MKDELDFLYGLNPSKMKFGLEPVQRALSALGHPERQFPTLHVAGTNGKGSTCAFLASCLRENGHKVGLYTSPHLVSVNERFRIGREDIPDDVLARRIGEILTAYPESRDLTFFEFGTVLAFWHFAKEKVDVAVIETGLGGRLDATNCCQPWVTAVTSISFDHTQYLGNTLDAIATEKAGIFKPRVPAVVAPQKLEALGALERGAARVESPWIEVNKQVQLSRAENGTLVFLGQQVQWNNLELGLRGAHQLENAAVALGCLEQLSLRGFNFTEHIIQRGMKNAEWPGRLEWFLGEPSILLDGAHNVGGMLALKNHLMQLGSDRRLHFVFGALADKDYAQMMGEFFPTAESVHFCPVDSPRSLSAEELKAASSGFKPEAESHASFEEALQSAIDASQPSDIVVVCGSLVLIGQAKKWMSRKGVLGAMRHTS